ncbi:MAG: spore protease YyaC [Bacillota bacterium]|jgi:putative sporulation protein YyaC|nr:MAG: spore protease YyaC [Bacillota bacterium]
MEAPGAVSRLREAVEQGMGRLSARDENVAVVCVGTDRSTGDALGPLTGHKLQALAPRHVPIFGTLEEPVHAGNLAEKMADITRRFPRHLFVAVDACLGSLENVGTICVGQGALRPGAGVNKVLPPVGDLHVTGVVNVGGFMEYFVLQNTRLHLVMRMSTVIAEGLAELLARPVAAPSANRFPARAAETAGRVWQSST